MGDEANTHAGKPADATLILRLASVRDFAEAIGATTGRGQSYRESGQITRYAR